MRKQEMDAKGEPAIVTGGASGLGEATAGARVTIFDLITERGQDIAAEFLIRNGYMNGAAVRLDGALRMPPR
jgi:NAD(P)-dependent dehydrogenase (short-subunit alcohol dehydrogenase family)